MTEENKILEKLKKVMHPAINMNLVDLGVIVGAEIKNEKIIITMAFPVLGIPIKDLLLSKVREALFDFSEEVDFKVREMSEEEKTSFLNLEHANWKGM